MKATNRLGLAIVATLTAASTSTALACSPAMQYRRAIHGGTPDCYDANTAAIYGNRALATGHPPPAWVAKEKRRKRVKSKASGEE